jgi:hypothetical protein
MPIVSAVYSVADEDDSATPYTHSTGRVWDDMDPTGVKGCGSPAVDKSLCDVNQLSTSHKSNTGAYQSLTTRSELPETKILSVGKTKRLLTKSVWAAVDEITALV